MSGGSLRNPLDFGQLNWLVIGHPNKTKLRALLIGQGRVVTSQENSVMPQGCYKSMTTDWAEIRREVAFLPQLYPLLFLEFSALFSAPA